MMFKNALNAILEYHWAAKSEEFILMKLYVSCDCKSPEHKLMYNKNLYRKKYRIKRGGESLLI